jgi:hypothetical protein
MAVTEHWNYDDSDKKDFHGGYAFMSQGPLPVGWAQATAINRGMWGMPLRQEMTRYNHIAGLRIVGETDPSSTIGSRSRPIRTNTGFPSRA